VLTQWCTSSFTTLIPCTVHNLTNIAELIQNYLEVGEYTFDFVVVFLGVSVLRITSFHWLPPNYRLTRFGLEPFDT